MAVLKFFIAAVIGAVVSAVVIGTGLIVQAINQIYKEWTDDF